MTEPVYKSLKPCENEFNRLAKESPQVLIDWIRSGELEPCLLTFAAEALRDAKHEQTVPALLDLLNHSSAIVREGAIYGVTPYVADPIVMAKLRAMQKDDPSKAVRETAGDTADYGDP